MQSLLPLISPRILQVILLGILAYAPGFAQQGLPASPRIQALQAALASRSPDALPQFWSDVKRHGSPLIEPIKERRGFALVTFLWRGSQGARDVLLLSGPQFLSHFKNQFTQLPDSDLWYLSVEMPEGVRIGYVISETSLSAGPDGAPIEKQAAGSDPLNLRRSEYDPTLSPSGTEPYSIFETPNAPQEPWLRRHPSVQPGKVETFEIPSAVLKTTRKIQIYRPALLETAGSPSGCLYLFDGESYLSDMHLPDVLDNLVSAGKLRPTMAILISQLPGEERDRELSCDPMFTEFVCAELVPWVRAHYSVSRDATRNIIGGYSLGALEAAFIARMHPDLFGAVLAQSPSLWWQPSGSRVDESTTWLAQEYLAFAGKPMPRLYLSVGRDEPTIIDKSKAFERLMSTRGYRLCVEEVEGQHDPINWRLTLPRGLLFLSESKEGI